MTTPTEAAGAAAQTGHPARPDDGGRKDGGRSSAAYAARVQFVSVEEQAVALFAAGHSYRSAWRILTADHGLSLSYHAFLRNAQKRLAPDALPGGRSPLTSNAPKSPEAQNAGDGPSRLRPDRPRFHYDPANNRREDLI